MSPSLPVTRVAIIGAGSSGLATLKQVVDAFARPEVSQRTTLDVVVYEAKSDVGGVWLADCEPKRFCRKELPSTKGDGGEQLYFYPPDGEDPSPMYEGLRTNLPYDVMQFREHGFPPNTAVFPDRETVLAYLSSYADRYSLRQHIRFQHRVLRLRHSGNPTGLFSSSATWPLADSRRRWTIDWRGPDEEGRDEYDFVCVANGHYADGWIPEVPGLSSFPGEILQSRFYVRPQDFVGRNVMVVGSFASGGDISRQLGSLNVGKYTTSGEPVITTPTGIENVDYDPSPPPRAGSGSGFTKVWCSMSSPTANTPDPSDPNQPFAKDITFVPLISHLEPPSPSHPSGRIHFQPHEGEQHDPVEGVDTIIFATGYNYHLPFCKAGDEPWSGHRMLDSVVREGEREGGKQDEEGGMKGLGVKGLDELLLFLEGDRSIAFPALPYQVVPFPLAEIQGRLAALLWAGLLPSFPPHPKLPINPSNPFWTPPPTPTSSTPEPTAPSAITKPLEKPTISFQESRSVTPSPRTTAANVNGPKQQPLPPSKATRKVMAQRQKLVFGAPYEWTYEEYLMGLMAEADHGRDVEDHWKKVEPWRRERRADTGLRKRTLGY